MAPKYQDLRLHITSLIEAAIQAADPSKAVRSNLQRDGKRFRIADLSYDPGQGNIYVVSVGKASLAMGRTAVEILGDDLFRGIFIAKLNQLEPPQYGARQFGARQFGARQFGADDRDQPSADASHRIEIYGAGHPISDENSISATEAVIEMLKATTHRDLVLCLISGGTSSLLTRPVIPLIQWGVLVNHLLASGCTIYELNAVRKRLDLVKGGGLAKSASPARCVSLILSDVVGNRLDVIGSGPTVQNPDQPGEARSVLDRYHIKSRLPEDVWEAVVLALGQQADELAGNKILAENFIVGDVRQAAGAVVDKAGKFGFSANLLTAQIEGEAREVGKVAAALAKDAPPNSLLVMGGETTVTVSGDGLGGRNQEVALAAAITLKGWKNRAVISFATDGDDGPTDAAGAFATGDSAALARAKSIDPVKFLDNNDSYRFFDQIDGLIRTGPTGTNVNDIILVINYVN